MTVILRNPDPFTRVYLRHIDPASRGMASRSSGKPSFVDFFMSTKLIEFVLGCKMLKRQNVIVSRPEH